VLFDRCAKYGLAGIIGGYSHSEQIFKKDGAILVKFCTGEFGWSPNLTYLDIEQDGSIVSHSFPKTKIKDGAVVAFEERHDL
jgi:hypothetical protein